MYLTKMVIKSLAHDFDLRNKYRKNMSDIEKENFLWELIQNS